MVREPAAASVTEKKSMTDVRLTQKEDPMRKATLRDNFREFAEHVVNVLSKDPQGYELDQLRKEAQAVVARLDPDRRPFAGPGAVRSDSTG